MSLGRGHEPIPEEAERAAAVVVDACIAVHRALGPGLLESIYERCLAYEIRKRGLRCERQVKLPVYYDGHKLDEDLAIDLLVEGCLLLELKAVTEILPVHEAQVISYLRLSKLRLGLLINFHVALMKSGIRRFVH